MVLEDGTEITAEVVLSNATPKVTYFDLLPKVSCCKINVSMKALASFLLLSLGYPAC